MAFKVKQVEIKAKERWMSRRLWIGVGALLGLVVISYTRTVPWADFLTAYVAITGMTLGVIGATDIVEWWASVRQSQIGDTASEQPSQDGETGA